MLLSSSHLFSVWATVVTICTQVLAQPAPAPPIPNPGITLGIARDFTTGTDPTMRITSFSGIIQFKEDQKNAAGQYPTQFMSDRQFLTLAVLAHQEMRRLASDQQIPTANTPGSMIAFGLDSKIYFASSMKGNYEAFYAGSSLPQQAHIFVADMLAACQTATGLTHRTNNGCAEPSVLDLALVNSEDSANLVAGRMAVWVLPQNGNPQLNAPPCGKFEINHYGCHNVVFEMFKITNVISFQQPQGNGVEWKDKFSNPRNKRNTGPQT